MSGARGTGIDLLDEGGGAGNDGDGVAAFGEADETAADREGGEPFIRREGIHEGTALGEGTELTRGVDAADGVDIGIGGWIHDTVAGLITRGGDEKEGRRRRAF